jgi:serine/threonine-protein kinase
VGAERESTLECPDEESLHRYLEGKVASSRAEAIRAHLVVCSVCRAGAASLGASNADAEPADTDLKSEEIPALIDGRYAPERVLGRGASATVYVALDRRLGERVALKVFRGLGEKVAQELLLARRISHPNVCRVFDAGVADGAAYLTMELVDGRTLADLLAAHEGEPLPEGDRIVREILKGLAAAHEAGIVHRDLKPQNVLVDPSGRVVLTDFGLARLASEEESRARLIGTPATWSPEQARGEPATFASDVYSFGVVAYRVLTGVSFKLSATEPFRKLSPSYRRLLSRALALAPHERVQSAGEALRLLEGGSAPRGLPLGLGLGALVLLAAVGLGLRHARAPSPPGLATSEPSAGPDVSSVPGSAVSSAPVASSPVGSASPQPSAASIAPRGSAHLPAAHVSRPTPSSVEVAPKATSTAAPSAAPELLFGK